MRLHELALIWQSNTPSIWRRSTSTCGLEINANHLKGTSQGWVTGTARPLHRGRSTQVWQIELRNDAGELTCMSRITMAMLQPR